MRTTKLLPVTIAAFALALSLAACGSSSGSDSSKDSTTTEAKGSDDGDSTTTEADSDDEDATTTVVATGGGEFCDDLAAYINDTSVTDVDPTDPAAYKAAIEEQTSKGKEILSNAPDELSDSVEVILDAQDELIAELEKVDYDFTKLGPDALSSMGTPEVEAAGEELNAYVTDTCGIDIPQVTAATIPDMTTMTVPN